MDGIQIAPHVSPASLPLSPVSDAYVIAQLGQSLDGRIATDNGDSKYINGTGALDHLHGLRASVDAVLVGIGTVLADDPLLTVRRVPGHSPARVVIDPCGRVPRGAKIFTDDGVRQFLICGIQTDIDLPPWVEPIRLARVEGRFAPSAIIAALAARGLSRLLVEGGADTISRFIDAGMIDELHTLVAPLILGSGKPGLSLAPIIRLDQAIRPRTEIRLFADGDVLFLCKLKEGA